MTSATIEFGNPEPPGRAMHVIEVRNLVKRYRRAQTNAVDDVSFDVEPGTLFCLLGPNGAGKTTTLSILTTTLAPTSGRAVVAGWDVALRPERVRQELGIVFQGPSLDANLTAEENLRVHAVVYGLYPWRPLYRLMPRGYRDQVQALAGVLGITDLLRRPVRELSGGTRRKLELVRGLMHSPRVLLLDEPTAGLDPESRHNLWAYLSDIQAREGLTIVLTTHYLEEAEPADVVCVMARGRIITITTPDRLKSGLARREMLIDSTNRAKLQGELCALGLPVAGSGPFRVTLNGLPLPEIIRALNADITQLQVREPTLEESYLNLLEEESVWPSR